MCVSDPDPKVQLHLLRISPYSEAKQYIIHILISILRQKIKSQHKASFDCIHISYDKLTKKHSKLITSVRKTFFLRVIQLLSGFENAKI